MKKIALIGAGQLGSRHLQALAKIDIPVTLQVVDPSNESLKVAKERYQEIQSNSNINSIDFLHEIGDLNAYIDLCIIATTAGIRFKILNELIHKKNVKNIILEKVVYQSEEQFEKTKLLLDEKKISCWVNCPRRIYPIYKELKEYFVNDKTIECNVSGGDWGLASNAIHLIDLVSFFSNNTNYKVNISELDSHIQKAKREGYIEVTGKLTGHYSKGSTLEMISIAGSNAPVTIELQTRSIKIHLNESAAVARIIFNENEEAEKIMRFAIPFQSDLTQHVAKEILMNGICGLTDFKESSQLHKPLLRSIMKHIQIISGNKVDYCPIT